MSATAKAAEDPDRLPNLEQLLQPLEAATRERDRSAVELLHGQILGSERLRGEVAAYVKGDRSPVTLVDLLHQTQAQQMIAARFPGDGFIAEESPALQAAVLAETAALAERYYEAKLESELPGLPATGRFTWLMDPIDGTKGFLARRYYAIAIGCFLGETPLLAVMATPRLGDSPSWGIDGAIALAVAGHGAWIARREAGAELDFVPLGKPAEAAADRVRVALSLEHAGPLADTVETIAGLSILRLDSQAKYLAVAAGDLEAYVRRRREDGRPDAMWDHMPGGLIAIEAGCAVAHFDASPLRWVPSPTIDLRGGCLCYRPPARGPLADLLARLTD